MVRKKELVHQLDEYRKVGDVQARELSELRDSLKDVFNALTKARIDTGAGLYSFVYERRTINAAYVESQIRALREERDLYRNAFILAAHTEAIRSAADPKEVARAQKAHRKAGAPRIAYDGTTGATRLLYPAPPEKSPLEAS